MSWCCGSVALPFEIALALGAVVESAIVFLLLVVNAGHWGVFLALTGIAAGAAWQVGRRGPSPLKGWSSAGSVVIAAYGVWYLVNALAPEITPGRRSPITSVWRANTCGRGGFPDRIAFYELLPQGMEMLYTVAYTFGRHPAAKLVEFAFLSPESAASYIPESETGSA